MASYQILFSALLMCGALHQGFSVPVESDSLLTTTPEPGRTTPVHCPVFHCPFMPLPQFCTSIRTTYFEYHGLLCRGCDICVVETTTAPSTE
ncbi:hypothetical protein BsWGS_00809 [Bradybaena similaris]